jgi:hypothetical protein
MAQEAPTVGDVFRRAQGLQRENPNLTRKDLKRQLVREYEGKPFPPTSRLAIPEQDAYAPEEDWTAGLSIALRGIQTENWSEVIDGVLMCLEQTEAYKQERGKPSDNWHDRSKGIRQELTKNVGKWMPADLMNLAEKAAKR